MPFTPSHVAAVLPFARTPLLPAALAIGAVEPDICDSFTHDSAFVRGLPLLFAQVGPLRVFKWLQHASSLLGVVAVAAFVLWWRRHTPIGQPAPTRLSARSRRLAWLVVGASGLTVALVSWIGGIASGVSPLDNALVFRTVVVGIAVAVLAAIAATLRWRTRTAPAPAILGE